MDFAVPDDHKIKLKVLRPCWRIEKSMEHESDCDTNCNRCTLYSHQRIGTGTGGLGNKRTSEDHTNYRIVEIGWNAEKSHGDLSRLAVI